MLKATAGTVLPTTITGSLPRPSWYTENLGIKSFLDAMVISRFREQYVDALSVYLREQEVAGLDIVTDGDCRFDQDVGGQSWTSYPPHHMAGFETQHPKLAKVGDITLNEPATRVEREYGSVGHGFHVVDRYSGAIYGYYRLHGSKVFLTFDRGRVSDIGFTTPYYRTRSGFGVGSRIPLGPCHRTATTPCEHRWRGFLYNLRLREDPCRCWVKVGLGARSLRPTTENFLKPWFFIYLSHGRVARLYFAWRYVD